MGVFIDVASVEADLTRLELAHDTLDAVRPAARDARTHDLASLQSALTLASTRVEGTLGVASAAVAELRTTIEDCVRTYRATDHRSAGTFHELA